MPRPLMQLGVGDLEALFASSKVDVKVLKQLEYELQYRQVPRAVALFAEVQAVLCDVTSTTPAPARPKPAPAPVPQQTGSGERSATPVTGSVVAPIATPGPADPIKMPEPLAVPKIPPPVQPVMSVDDAYKLLKSTAGSTWESIEQIRRQTVLQSSPLITRSMSQDRRSQLLAEAKHVNAAYAVLSKHRTGSR